MKTTSPLAEHWHLDKKVPIALILTLVLHLGGSVWFFRGMLADLHETQRRVAALEGARTNEKVSERMAVLESSVKDTKETTLRIEADVKKLLERRP